MPIFIISRSVENKEPVIISRREIMQAYKDLIKYYDTAPVNNNTLAVKQSLIYILEEYDNEKIPGV